MKNGIYYILLMTAGVVIGYLLHRPKGQEPQIVEIVKTVTIRDTVKLPEPMPYLVENTDTVYIEVFAEGDEPLQVPLIHQKITYTDDSTYTAVVSGYNPKLDYIETYKTTHYITEKVYEKPKKWGVGIQAGYGAGKNGVQPYIGIGVSYNVLRF